MSEYNLCSLLVHVRSGHETSVKQQLEKQPGNEVHAQTEDSRLIVTVEADTRRDVAQQIMDVQNIEGVLSAAMIYQFSDEVEELEPVQERMSA